MTPDGNTKKWYPLSMQQSSAFQVCIQNSRKEVNRVRPSPALGAGIGGGSEHQQENQSGHCHK